MGILYLYYFIIGVIGISADEGIVILSNDGPAMLGAKITFKAELYKYNGQRPSGTFKYKWNDNTINYNQYETGYITNNTSSWTLSYSHVNNTAGSYKATVTAFEYEFGQQKFSSKSTNFNITNEVNGYLNVIQYNKTINGKFVLSTSPVKIAVNIREGDYEYIKNKATSLSVFWFIDCKYYGKTNDLTFVYNVSKPGASHELNALVIASYNHIKNTSESTLLLNVSNPVNASDDESLSLANLTTLKPLLIRDDAVAEDVVSTEEVFPNAKRFAFPHFCPNSLIISTDPKKSYGFFTRQILVRAPITNITVDGTNWIQPWNMLSLNVSFKGSTPFKRCLQFHRGIYNSTGNETCGEVVKFDYNNFSISHYFLEPSVYTILVILANDVSTQIYPLTINIYKVTPKSQLSVIIIPVSCTLIAVVLVVFGIAFYLQSRARFTVEVADFDFGKNNPEMEYKKFWGRLRDSFNTTVSSWNKRISVRQPCYGSTI
ncbi:uncharacterized protein [Prorops nasuta]|uniref:uncharacterized protein n=1 Tax=Prorops nasuta TaxID=863751 RepID=UPI0034CFFBB5